MGSDPPLSSNQTHQGMQHDFHVTGCRHHRQRRRISELLANGGVREYSILGMAAHPLSDSQSPNLVAMELHPRHFFRQDAVVLRESDCIVNVSDDAAWEISYLVQVHEVTGDSRALADAAELLPHLLTRFEDPNAPAVYYGSLRGSPYGILYATPTDDPDHQGRSSTYEIMIANSALYLYRQTYDSDYLNYAIGTWNWTRKYMKHPARGYYYCELDIRPTVNGSKNPHYLVPVGDYFGPPVRGLSSSYSGGTMAMAVASARLFRITGQQQYLDEARDITTNFVRRDAFLRPGNVFVNERDAWTDGFWAPCFSFEVLSLSGVDPSNLFKAALRNTALSIILHRTSDGFYGADWSGPERNTNDGSMTWVEQAQHGTGSGGGMALPGQIMTSCNSAAMIVAAEVLEHGSEPLRAKSAAVPAPRSSAPSEPEKLLSMAMLFIQNKNLDLARERLRQIVEQYPNDPAAQKAGQLLEEIGN